MRKNDQTRCEVCLGIGTYPIINRLGEDLYSIPCPECHRQDLARLAMTDWARDRAAENIAAKERKTPH